MDIFEAIEKRHCYRGAFKDTAVLREDLQRMVEAGLKAPSGKNIQTTTFVAVDDEGILSTIRTMHPANKAAQQCRALIACVVDKEPEAVFEGLEFQVEDCAAAVENIFLACTALGYSTVWIDGWLRREGRAEKIGQLLGVPDEKIVRIILPIGIAAEEYKQPQKKPFNERAWFNRYGE